jgi:hypothetical protein
VAERGERKRRRRGGAVRRQRRVLSGVDAGSSRRRILAHTGGAFVGRGEAFGNRLQCNLRLLARRKSYRGIVSKKAVDERPPGDGNVSLAARAEQVRIGGVAGDKLAGEATELKHVDASWVDCDA